MTIINATVDNLIRSIKNTGGVDDIKFIKAYKTSAAPKPSEGLCAVASVGDIKPRKRFISGLCHEGVAGEVLSAVLRFRLYTAGSGGELTDAALRLCDSLREADVGEIVSGVEIHPICFDSACCEVYRDVSAELVFLLCGECDE